MQLSFGRLQTSGESFVRFADVPRHVELEVLEFAATLSGARALGDLLDTPFVESSHAVAERTLEALASGRLEYVAWSPAEGLTVSSVPDTDLAALAAEEWGEEVPIHAVVLELIDAQDRPVAGASYRLLDPEGRTHSGNLDHEGRAEIRQIRKAGNCKVSFPEFDNGAWSYIHAHPM